MEKAFDFIAAPIVRIGAKHTPIPTNPFLEQNYLPSLEDVVKAAQTLMQY
jgi:pyruvate/2-oxoglutarate/acetoin dehydrogenase E1 component